MPECVISLELIFVARAGHLERSDCGVWERSDSSKFALVWRRCAIAISKTGDSFQRAVVQTLLNGELSC